MKLVYHSLENGNSKIQKHLITYINYRFSLVHQFLGVQKMSRQGSKESASRTQAEILPQILTYLPVRLYSGTRPLSGRAISLFRQALKLLAGLPAEISLRFSLQKFPFRPEMKYSPAP